LKSFNVKKILIPLDFSETALLALEHGTNMASLFNADIILLHVITPNWAAYNIENMPMPIDVMQYLEENTLQKLNQISKEISHKQNIQVATVYETGLVAPTIVSAAEKSKADLILMGTHGISGFSERFIGSNAYRVVNDSQCPVITVQSHATKTGFKNIVLPIDLSVYSNQKVNHAVELAKLYGSSIHILGLTTGREEGEIEKLKIKLDEIAEFIENKGLIQDTRINTGVNYAKLTMSYAEQINADLIIIMTEWEEHVTGPFIGPFARQIVNHSKIPVMSIRPEVKAESIEGKTSSKKLAQL
jgi:nucleotide-binding universal stress UspA family protein